MKMNHENIDLCAATKIIEVIMKTKRKKKLDHTDANICLPTIPGKCLLTLSHACSVKCFALVFGIG
jgi:hypothetical protein